MLFPSLQFHHAVGTALRRSFAEWKAAGLWKDDAEIDRFELNFKENTENTVVDPIFTTYLLLNKITPNSDTDLMQKGVFCVKKGLIHGNTTFPTGQLP